MFRYYIFASRRTVHAQRQVGVMESCLRWQFEVLAVWETENRWFDASNHIPAEMLNGSHLKQVKLLC